MDRKLIISMSVVLLSLAQLAAAKVAFKPEQTYTVGTNPAAVVVGDFNHDGKLDLAVLNSGDASAGDNGGVSILLGNGDGTFQPAKNLAIGKNCTSIAGGDFDGDGNEDLVLVRPGDPTVSDYGDVTLFLGNGDGTFRQGQVVPLGTNPSVSNQAVLAWDLNGDGRLDLVVAHFSQFSVLLGNGNGTFQSPVDYPGFPGGASPTWLATVDLAGNGVKDLAVAGGLDLGLWLNNGDGTFSHGTLFVDSGLHAAGDFNGDRKDDLVVNSISVKCVYKCRPGSGGGTDSSKLLLGNGDGTFQPAKGVPFASGAGDFDGDGNMDLVGQSSQIQILPGNGDGTFQSLIAFAINPTETLSQVVDVNGDGAPDLVMIGGNSIGLLVNVGTDFSISATALNPSTLSAGQSATSSLALKLISRFDNPVSLTCSVQPAQPGGPACSLSSNSVSFDAIGEASATLTISADSQAALLNSRPFNSLLWLPVAGFAFLGTGIDVGPSGRRRLMILLASAALFLGIIIQAACGGGGGTSSISKPTAYTVVVTASSGATQHSTTVNLTVQ
jgi:hypothetical protein